MQAVKAKLSNISIPWRLVLKNVAAIVISLVALSWLHLRPLGIFFLSLFFYWIYKTRCNFRIIPPPELQKIYKFRKENRKMFGAALFTAGGFLAVGGPILTGLSLGLVLVAIAVILANKVEYEALRRERRRGRHYYNDYSGSETGTCTETGTDSESEMDDEFLPDTSSNNLVLLARASDQASYSIKTEDIDDKDDDDASNGSDDIPSELLIPDSIPELNENSTDDDDDLMPVINVDELNADPRTIASNIRFEKCHFKSDSSSSSEENLSKGLNFTDSAKPVNTATNDGVVAALVATTSAQALLEGGSKLLPSLVSGLIGLGNKNVATINSSKSKVKEEDRSSESDFEIIDHE
ncbi:PREDICTED: uncharacterized protein LOC108977268 [Bactrocera latifrons]|uniref:Uncharacterized protein n=1 Tax=Bactrocera latifrons TaxID=174628 RepID=A0A0K8VTK7_BACLA|nr:PREDICTED: uncharacterized protein LOC108977268 [Bactrocera latifrons]